MAHQVAGLLHPAARLAAAVFLLVAAGSSWYQAPAPGQDALGDPLPPGVLGRLGTVRLKTPSGTLAVAYSPDGRTIAAGSSDGLPVVSVLDVETGRQTGRFGGAFTVSGPSSSRGVMAVAYSPDGKMLVAGCYGLNVAQVWDTRSGTVLAKVPTQQGVTSVAFSPDSQLLACGSYDKTVYVADPMSGQVVHRLTGSAAAVYAVAFLPDGRTLLSAGEDRTVRFWDLKAGKELRRFPGHDKTILCLALSPDGRTLATGSSDQTARVWDLATGAERCCCRGHANAVQGMVFTRDGKQLITGGRDRTLRWWDPATGRERRQRPANGLDVAHIALAPDGRRLAVSGFEHGVCLYDATTGDELLPLPGHSGVVLSARFAPDGRTIATGSTDGTLRLWDARTGRERRLLARDDTGWFKSLSFAPDGRTLVASTYDKDFFLYDAATGQVLRKLSEPEGYIATVEFLPDGQTVASYSFTTAPRMTHRLTLWDVHTGAKRWTFPERFTCFAFSRDGKQLAVGTEVVALWDVAGRKLIRRLPVRGPFQAVTFRADGNGLLLASLDGTVQAWDLERDRAQRKRVPDGSRFGGVETVGLLSPDGRLTATADESGTVRLWEVATLTPIAELKGHLGGASVGGFAPDGRSLVTTGYDGTALVWDVLGLSDRTPVRLEPAQLDVLWADVTGPDASRAYRAVVMLARAAEQAVPHLLDRLHPPVLPSEVELARWSAALDSDRFAQRKEASEQLAKAGTAAEPYLRRALAARPSLEARQRIEQLLRRLEDGDHGVTSRSVAVLEYAGTPAARALLEKLAAEAPGSQLQSEARAALDRFKANVDRGSQK